MSSKNSKKINKVRPLTWSKSLKRKKLHQDITKTHETHQNLVHAHHMLCRTSPGLLPLADWNNFNPSLDGLRRTFDNFYRDVDCKKFSNDMWSISPKGTFVSVVSHKSENSQKDGFVTVVGKIKLINQGQFDVTSPMDLESGSILSDIKIPRDLHIKTESGLQVPGETKEVPIVAKFDDATGNLTLTVFFSPQNPFPAQCKMSIYYSGTSVK